MLNYFCVITCRSVLAGDLALDRDFEWDSEVEWRCGTARGFDVPGLEDDPPDSLAVVCGDDGRWRYRDGPDSGGLAGADFAVGEMPVCKCEL